MRFQTRWCITGILRTQTALHIGAGRSSDDHEKLKVEDEGVKVSAVALDGEGKPYIPGSTLKGNLRAWLATRLEKKALLDSVFGCGDDKKEENAQGSKAELKEENAQGGKAEFWNVLMKDSLKSKHQPAYWHSERKVGVEVGVTIERITRTAREQKLFHREIVPPGFSFEVRITGKGLTEEEVALLLAGLNGFNDQQQQISLGSNHAQNKGLMHWTLQEVKQLDEANTKKWIAAGAPGMWHSALQGLEQREVKRLLDKSKPLIAQQSNQPHLQLDFQLIFDSPFLVNEPALFIQNETPNHQPRQDHHGKAVLPSRSLRGAIRAQGERIIRTLEGRACLIDDDKLACKPIEKYEEVEKNLCLACQLFGGTGWRSPIRISDFRLIEQKSKLTQEFVAIDRFTGGGAEHLKFNAQSLYKPTFEGRLHIDLQRVKPWGLGLLALVIRDLIEGDITFGYGAAKGYGHCSAKLKNGSIKALSKIEGTDELKRKIEEVGLNTETPENWRDGDAVRTLINHCVNQFQKKCTNK